MSMRAVSSPTSHDHEPIQVDRAAGRMTLTSWVMLALLGLASVVVTGSTVACEVRGRDDCLQRATSALAAVGVGGGLLFTHSPAEGAVAAARGLLARRRLGGQPEPPIGLVGPMPPALPDPREIYAGGRRG